MIKEKESNKKDQFKFENKTSASLSNENGKKVKECLNDKRNFRNCV